MRGLDVSVFCLATVESFELRKLLARSHVLCAIDVLNACNQIQNGKQDEEC